MELLLRNDKPKKKEPKCGDRPCPVKGFKGTETEGRQDGEGYGKAVIAREKKRCIRRLRSVKLREDSRPREASNW